MVATADDRHCAQAVRKFKAKLDLVTLAYEPLTERIISAAGSATRKFSSLALRDARRAEAQANMFYLWARTLIPKDTDIWVQRSKASKLKLMPYFVVMAYAVRVKLDVFYVESCGLGRTEQLEYRERSRRVVEELTGILDAEMATVVTNSSLLDVALDYHLTLATYIALKAALQKSLQIMLAPEEAPRAIQVWDDGLSHLRYVEQ